MKASHATPRAATAAVWIAIAMTLAAPAGIPAWAQTSAPPALEAVKVRATARFDFDAADLRPGDRARLLAEVATLKDVSWQLVTAVGHTDAIGDPDYNRSLAQRRAAAVRDHLVRQGLAPDMIRVEARGEIAPEADNASPAGRARNRRTEVEFSGVRPAAR